LRITGGGKTEGICYFFSTSFVEGGYKTVCSIRKRVFSFSSGDENVISSAANESIPPLIGIYILTQNLD